MYCLYQILFIAHEMTNKYILQVKNDKVYERPIKIRSVFI